MHRPGGIQVRHFGCPVTCNGHRIETPSANLGQFRGFAHQHLLFAVAASASRGGHVGGDDTAPKGTPLANEICLRTFSIGSCHQVASLDVRGNSPCPRWDSWLHGLAWRVVLCHRDEIENASQPSTSLRRLDAKLFGCATREFSRLMFVVDLDNPSCATSMAGLKSALASSAASRANRRAVMS